MVCIGSKYVGFPLNIGQLEGICLVLLFFNKGFLGTGGLYSKVGRQEGHQ